MRKLKHLSFVCGIAVLMLSSSCKSLDQATLNPTQKNPQLLPNLTPVFDDQSFGTIFPFAHTRGTMYVNPQYGYGVSSSATMGNPQFNDIKIIFERDMANIFLAQGVSKGTLRCRAIDGRSRDGVNRLSGEAFAWAFASGLTLCTANLFGMPISVAKSKLQIEVTILDANNNVVGRYTSDLHRNKEYIAMYWGYSFANAPRKDARMVFTAAMNDIKRQIANDYTRLADALK